MSKAVLISIRPKWCEKIISGEKTIEVRKTRPKMNPPFKCYIYRSVQGGVIGEFVCDHIFERIVRVSYGGWPAHPRDPIHGGLFLPLRREAGGGGCKVQAHAHQGVPAQQKNDAIPIRDRYTGGVGMAEDEKRCTLPKSARCCQMEYADDEACTHCGWQPEERARRKALPLTEDENGVRRKHVGKEQTDG